MTVDERTKSRVQRSFQLLDALQIEGMNDIELLSFLQSTFFLACAAAQAPFEAVEAATQRGLQGYREMIGVMSQKNPEDSTNL